MVAELVRLSNNTDFVSIKAYSFGEMLVDGWRELYPREFEMHSACVCNSGVNVIEPPNINKGGGKGKKSLDGSENLEENINNEIKIYPNPTTGELRVTSNELRTLSKPVLSIDEVVEVYDVVGKL